MDHELNKEQQEFLDLLLDVKGDYLGEPLKRLVNMQKLIVKREKFIRQDQKKKCVESAKKGVVSTFILPSIIKAIMEAD